MKKRYLFYCLIASQLFLILLSGASALAAEKYPDKAISVVIPAAPGGSSDIVARLVSDKLQKNLGVPIVVDNRGGASGIIGAQYFVNSKPDGYTIGLFSSSEIVLIPATNLKAPYKFGDLVPLSKYATSITAVYCTPDKPWKTLEDLVADAKKRPGQITYGVNTGNVAHYQMEGYLKAAGINIRHIPMEASASQVVQVLGGLLDTGITSMSSIVGQVKAGKLRVLFTSATERLSILPQVRTLKESGYPEPILYMNFGFVAPPGVPKPIMETLEKGLEKSIKDPEVKQRLMEVSAFLTYLPRAAYAKEVQESYKQVTEFAKTFKIGQ